jgi:methionine-rich copper-binding protein CopC
VKRRDVISGLLLSLLPIFTPDSASAHSQLVSSAPAKNSVISVDPGAVELTFNESLIVIKGQITNRITVTDSQRKVWSAQKIQVYGNKAKVALISRLKNGKYLVTYRVVSQDGHPIKGNFSFTYKAK